MGGSPSSLSSNGKYKTSFLDYNQIINQLKSGDLIEVMRDGCDYYHCVMFEKAIDNNYMCYHITTIDGKSGIKQILTDRAILKYEPLADILKDTDNEEMSMCRINNQENTGHKVLTEAGKGMPSLDKVFGELCQLKDCIVKYCFNSNNCEYFATLWKYGIGWSAQVNSVADIVSTVSDVLSATSTQLGSVMFKSGHIIWGCVCLLFGIVCKVVGSIAHSIVGFGDTLKLMDEYVIRYPIGYSQ